MQKQEYKARDKTVTKMSRDGLMEENLQSQNSVRVSQRELDSLNLPGQAADLFELQKGRTYAGEQKDVGKSNSDTQNPLEVKQRRIQSGQWRRLYEVHEGNLHTESENKLLETNIQSKVENISEDRTSNAGFRHGVGT